jgi:sugar/nucleoside kinase (ribokinase family)
MFQLRLLQQRGIYLRSMDLITVGTVAFDSIETPFGKADKVVGGAATFISLAASLLVDEVGLISVVGDDFPQETLDLLKGRGVDLAGLEILEGKKSFFWSGRYHYDMNSRDTLDTQLNVLLDLDPQLPEHFKAAPFVMLGNLDPGVQLKVIEQMSERPELIVMDTMNFWMDSALDKLKEVIAKVDVLTINDEEARQLSNEHSLVKAARKIRAMGPSVVVIKKGEHGALLFNGTQVFFAPALPLEDVVDPTGAGDTFAGGFIGHLAKTRDTSFESMKRGIVVGSALASFCCEKFGTERLREVTNQELEDRIKEFESLVQVDMIPVA